VEACIRHAVLHLRSSFWSSEMGSPPMNTPMAAPGAGMWAASWLSTSALCSAISCVDARISTCWRVAETDAMFAGQTLTTILTSVIRGDDQPPSAGLTACTATAPPHLRQGDLWLQLLQADGAEHQRLARARLGLHDEVSAQAAKRNCCGLHRRWPAKKTHRHTSAVHVLMYVSGHQSSQTS
jgi:hypothetical protein